jgi:hypothetical protein
MHSSWTYLTTLTPRNNLETNKSIMHTSSSRVFHQNIDKETLRIRSIEDIRATINFKIARKQLWRIYTIGFELVVKPPTRHTTFDWRKYPLHITWTLIIKKILITINYERYPSSLINAQSNQIKSVPLPLSQISWLIFHHPRLSSLSSPHLKKQQILLIARRN